MDPIERCRRFGWWSLLVWLGLGLVLEALHGFKVGWYLGVVNDGRRLQLTLAHSHGVLLALVALAFVATVRPADVAKAARIGACLRWAGVLMPAGFLLGGVFANGADPGLPIVLVPIGGLLLFTGVLTAALAVQAPGAPQAEPPPVAPPGGKAGKGGR
jgi:hypothetical protein